jgi:oligopeptide/dipeptide ABC transporter ATP-binding protein
MTEELLRVEDLYIKYRMEENDIHAVSDVSFTIEENEYFGLVGESGSGKSTIASAILGALDANGEVTSGKITYRGEDITHLSDSEFSSRFRWDNIATIPQASMNSLDPVRRLSDQAIGITQTHTDWSKKQTLERLRDLFDVVGLAPERINDYPFQFSGGMQQRAIIALSLLLDPDLLIADEPTTALDVILQDQIMAHLNDLRDELDISVLFITHDMAVILENCDSLGVLHGGQLSEIGPTTEVFDNPGHPYSYLLQQAFPDYRYPDQELTIIEGQPPQLKSEVGQCTFAERCPWAAEECKMGAPPLETVDGDDAHKTSCIRTDEIEELRPEDPTKNV